MSTPLRDILFEIDTMLSIEDELTEDQAKELDAYLDELAEAEADKIDGAVAWMKECKARAKFLKDEAKILTGKAKALENAVERLRNNYLTLFEKEGIHNRIAGKKYTLFIKRSKSVAIDNESDIPEEWWRVSIDRQVKKDELGRVLASGQIVPGVHLEEKKSIQMK